MCALSLVSNQKVGQRITVSTIVVLVMVVHKQRNVRRATWAAKRVCLVVCGYIRVCTNVAIGRFTCSPLVCVREKVRWRREVAASVITS